MFRKLHCSSKCGHDYCNYRLICRLPHYPSCLSHCFIVRIAVIIKITHGFFCPISNLKQKYFSVISQKAEETSEFSDIEAAASESDAFTCSGHDQSESKSKSTHAAE